MIEKSSFRDPSGYIFYENEKVYRAISKSFKLHFEKAKNDLIYDDLIKKKQLIPHKEQSVNLFDDLRTDIYKVIEHQKINFISYPYEWSFSQFKLAASLTLEIQLYLLERDYMLKDATPYNIQFIENSPIFIDTLSIEKIQTKDYTWKAFKQFSEMFLMPLILMSKFDLLSNRLLETNINGIDHNLFFKTLPFIKRFYPGIFTNIYLPYLIQKKYNNSTKEIKSGRFLPKKNAVILTKNLLSVVDSIRIKKAETEWAEYYEEVEIEKPDYLKNKIKVLENFIQNIKLDHVWDLGSNDGVFSSIFSHTSKGVFSIDIDPLAVEKNFLKNKNSKKIFPLRIDFTSPSSSIGWLNQERKNIFERLPKPNMILALAIIHHFINSNISIERIFDLFKMTKKFLVVEYIPIDDPKAIAIFSSRGPEFKYPSINEFEKLAELDFKILKKLKLEPTNRVLFFLEKIIKK